MDTACGRVGAWMRGVFLRMVDGGCGRIACLCGCIACGRMRGRKIKIKEPARWGWWTQVRGSADALRMRTDTYEWKKKKKEHLLMGLGCARRGMGMRMAALACGRGCVVCGCG